MGFLIGEEDCFGMF
jgi:hypothetical protein